MHDPAMVNARRTPAKLAVIGVVAGAVLVGVATLALLPVRDDVDAATPTAVMILPIVLAAMVGGGPPAVVTALLAGLAINLAYLRPYGTLKIRAVEDGIGLVAFVVVALLVGLLVSNLRARRRESLERQRDLQALLEERSALLTEARRAQQLAELDAERTSVLRSVSHDLRTPLSAIRAIAGDLRDGVAYDDDTRRELLGTVVTEADRLDRMVANLLSMSRIEAGAFAPERTAVDVGELVRTRVRALAGVLAPFEITLRIPDGLPFVDGDELQLEQVLTNLLANAARHSPAGSDLWIVVSTLGGQVRIDVSDRGPGIAVADRERVFLPFERGPGSRSSGVGLAICKAVVEAHGGRIWIEQRFGGGATVSFTVPALAAERIPS